MKRYYVEFDGHFVSAGSGVPPLPNLCVARTVVAAGLLSAVATALRDAMASPTITVGRVAWQEGRHAFRFLLSGGDMVLVDASRFDQLAVMEP